MGLTRWGPRFRLSFPPSWLALAGLAAGVAVAPPVPVRYRYVPLVAVGLPHGAVDHLALPRAAGERPTRRWLARVGALYLGLGAAYAAVWFLAPPVALVGFVALTWFHWGQGDLYPLLAVVGADHLRARAGRALAVAVRGGLPMLVPLVAFPERYRAVVGAILGLFGGGAVAAAFRPDVRAALAAGFLGLTVAALALGYARADHGAGWLVDAGETALLWWYFLTVPPVLAVGAYFVVWHSLRHVARLLALDPANVLDRGRTLAALVRFAREATPLTLASLLAFAGIYLAVPRPPGDLRGLAAVYLVFIAVLTLPHVAVVSLMDREQGL